MVRMAWVGGVLCGLACTSVHMVQRDGCWMKKTERTFGGSREELGFCTREQPEWAQDRLARLVQECMAQADYRWENRAIASWTRGEPIPPQESDAEITKVCMAQATQAMGIEAENTQLRSRLSELGQDRDALRAVTDKDREFLQQNSDKMVSALGEAAKKPAPSATATATSTGTAKTESDQRSASTPAAAPVVVGPPSPVVVTSPPARLVHAPASKTNACVRKDASDKLAAAKAPAPASACGELCAQH